MRWPRSALRRPQRGTINAPHRHLAMPTRIGSYTTSRSFVDVSTLLGDDAETLLKHQCVGVTHRAI